MSTKLIVIFLLILHLAAAEDHDQLVNNDEAANFYLHKKIDCGVACTARCRLASRHKMCIRACGTCCARCRCVPPGTSGNLYACGACYGEMKTHGGRRKCP